MMTSVDSMPMTIKPKFVLLNPNFQPFCLVQYSSTSWLISSNAAMIIWGGVVDYVKKIVGAINIKYVTSSIINHHDYHWWNMMLWNMMFFPLDAAMIIQWGVFDYVKKIIVTINIQYAISIINHHGNEWYNMMLLIFFPSNAVMIIIWWGVFDFNQKL